MNVEEAREWYVPLKILRNLLRHLRLPADEYDYIEPTRRLF